MKKTFITAVLLSILTFQSAFSTEPNKPAEPNRPAKIEVPRDANYVVAVFDGKELTLREINYLAPGTDAETVKNIADFWINTQLLYEEAVKEGIDKDAKARFLADIAFKKAIASALIEQTQSKINISDEQIRKYYDGNKETDPRLKEPVYLSFSHITTDTNEQAIQVKSKIEQGEEINELAKTMSVASDAKKGGRATKYREDTVRQRFGQEFLNALSNASEGDIIGPVKNKDGKYEVARHEGKRAAHVIEFDKVKDQIRSTLESQEKQKAVQNLINTIRENAKHRFKKTGVFADPNTTENEKKSNK